jgi:hypothetical protein
MNLTAEATLTVCTCQARWTASAKRVAERRARRGVELIEQQRLFTGAGLESHRPLAARQRRHRLGYQRHPPFARPRTR